jgi:hypothetical protein
MLPVLLKAINLTASFVGIVPVVIEIGKVL